MKLIVSNEEIETAVRSVVEDQMSGWTVGAIRFVREKGGNVRAEVEVKAQATPKK